MSASVLVVNSSPVGEKKEYKTKMWKKQANYFKRERKKKLQIQTSRVGDDTQAINSTSTMCWNELDEVTFRFYTNFTANLFTDLATI